MPGRNGVQQLSAFAFLWRQDREGCLEAAEAQVRALLAEPVARSDASEGNERFQYLERNGKFNVMFSTSRTW